MNERSMSVRERLVCGTGTCGREMWQDSRNIHPACDCRHRSRLYDCARLGIAASLATNLRRFNYRTKHPPSHFVVGRLLCWS